MGKLTKARHFGFGLLTGYLLIGGFLAVAMSRAIPAMNAAGVAYYAAIWPWFIASGAYGAPDPPIPAWCFTFEAGRQALGDSQ